MGMPFLFAYQSTYAQALKIMSYNCRMSGEMTGYSVKEYAVFIRKYNPDVVMLQEIDYNTKRNKNQDFTTQLAAELGLFSVFGKAMDTGGGEYGVAILSKYPFVYINNKTFEGIDGGQRTPDAIICRYSGTGNFRRNQDRNDSPGSFDRPDKECNGRTD
ncbi:endonuclease/exonuclease/phosphatase family protein [Bacteroides ovatus]|uniref:endonuclease/exonuclease/phosphatase family protein n=1 Tax=Bacteroides ovatus TaxID=28116 RepID=UPI0021646F8A|nr:endonuclease/exonuclease/phosphatase family protein [Bacteroides ovatus]UVR39099.1 endonuclease/exonuclease/phosphatase family protein [Bacteroides ovatus]